MFELVKYCECGCGAVVSSGKRFIHGHNGKVRSPESLQKIVDDIRNRWRSSEYKLRVGKAISQALKGRRVWWGQKISYAKKGKKHKISCGCSFCRDKFGEKNPFYGKTHSEEVRLKLRLDKLGKTYEEIYGAEKGSLKRVKTGLTTRERLKDPVYFNFWRRRVHKALGKKPNKLEKFFMENVLNKVSSGCKYAGDGKVLIGGRCPDFVDISQKKIVEIFGDYWHKDENPEDRIAYFAKYGWRCLVIWEHEIYQNLDDVKVKVDSFLQNTERFNDCNQDISEIEMMEQSELCSNAEREAEMTSPSPKELGEGNRLTIILDDFIYRRGVATAYGKKVVNEKFYVAGTVTNL